MLRLFAHGSAVLVIVLLGTPVELVVVVDVVFVTVDVIGVDVLAITSHPVHVLSH